MEIFEYAVYGGALLLVGAAAWWLRGRTHLRERRVLNELYMRKVRFAEEGQARAVQNLNENLVEVRAIRERFDGMEQEIRRLEVELQRAQSTGAAAAEELATTRIDLDEARARWKAHEEEHKNLREERIAFEESRSEVRARISEHMEEVARSRAEIAGLREAAERDGLRLQELEETARTAGELERRLFEQTDLAARREAELLELTERLEALDPLPAQLARALGELDQRTREVADLQRTVGRLQVLEGGLAERTQEFEARGEELAERKAELRALQLRVAELQPLEGKLAQSRSDLERREETLRAEREAAQERERALERRVVEQSQRSVAFEERAGVLDARLRRAEEERAELQARVEELERETRADLERREETLRAERDAAQERERALERKIVEQSQRSAEFEQRAGVLEARLRSAEGEATDLEQRLAKRGQELAASKEGQAEARHLAIELERAQKREATLEQRLEKERMRAQAALERLEAAGGVEAERKRELAAAREQLARVGASHRAVELKLDRTAKRVEELEAKLVEERTKARSLEEEGRVRLARVKTLESELVRAQASLKVNDEARSRARKASPSADDDLEALDGVGPALAKRMRRAGIRTYAQLASLDREGMEGLARRIGTSVDVFRQKGWVMAARRLDREKRVAPE